MDIEKDDDVIVGDLKLGWSFDLQGARKVVAWGEVLISYFGGTVYGIYSLVLVSLKLGI